MYNRQIQTFICAADYGSFSKAAEKLFVTPASVMNQINALEIRVGVKLLLRTNQGIKLTPAGCSIYKDAKHILEEAENAVIRAKQIAGAQQHVIRVGTSLLNPCKVLIDLWGEISNKNQNFQIKILPFEDDHTSILAKIASLGKTFDFMVGACGSREWLTRCNFYKLGDYSVCCAVSRKHSLADRKLLQVSDLYGETLMMIERGDTAEIDEIRDMLIQKHPQIKITDTPYFYDAEVFNACEHTGSVLLTLDAWREVHPSLVTIPVNWEYTVPYGLLYSKAPSEQVQMFIELFHQAHGHG
ncbi:MAG: LysR family transcriptional regulator [Clostridia bacterium]|nr:LysR family transcriptional regulator [Clostridia bacterium]